MAAKFVTIDRDTPLRVPPAMMPGLPIYSYAAGTGPKACSAKASGASTGCCSGLGSTSGSLRSSSSMSSFGYFRKILSCRVNREEPE